MASIDVSPLFQPLTIKKVTLKNRFVMPAMQMNGMLGRAPTPGMASYYRKRVEGGTSLVFSESAVIDHPTGTSQDEMAWIDEETVPGWRLCTDAVRDAGGVFMLQLWHEGAKRIEGKGRFPDAPALSPSGIFMKGHGNGRAATREEMVSIKEAHVRSAVLAMEAGAHGVELHCAHASLLDLFLWPDTNVRDDGYGGPEMSARVRYPAEVAAAIRQAIGPDALFSVRISQWKTFSKFNLTAYDAKVVESPADLEVLVRAFEAAGVDMFNISTRRFNRPEWPNSDLGLAGWVKSMTKLPVITVGSVGLDVDIGENSIGGKEAQLRIEQSLSELLERFSRNEFDLIGVGRSNIADPNWVEKIRQGKYDEVKRFSRDDLFIPINTPLNSQ